MPAHGGSNPCVTLLRLGVGLLAIAHRKRPSSALVSTIRSAAAILTALELVPTATTARVLLEGQW